MLHVLRTAAPLLFLLSILAAQQPMPTTRRPSEFPCAATAACLEIKRGLSDESGQAAAQVAASPSSTSAERYRKLRRDADELLRLAQELKESVNKTNGSILSAEVLNKAGRIEKLAKAVKNNLKNN